MRRVSVEGREPDTSTILDYVFDPRIQLDSVDIVSLASDLVVRSRILLVDRAVSAILRQFSNEEIPPDEFFHVVHRALRRTSNLGFTPYLKSLGTSLDKSREYRGLNLTHSPVAIDIGFAAIIAAIIAYCAKRDCTNNFWKASTKSIRYLRRMARFVRRQPVIGIMKQEEGEISAALDRAVAMRNVIEKADIGKRVKKKRLDHWDDRIAFLSEELKFVVDKSGEIRKLDGSSNSWTKVLRLLSLDL